MVEVIYYVAASLDGYIAPRDIGLSWLAPFESSEEDYGYADFYRSIDAVLVGSETFKQAAQFPQWPYPEKPCWVFSRQPLHTSLPHVFVTDQSPMACCCQKPGKNVPMLYRRFRLVHS